MINQITKHPTYLDTCFEIYLSYIFVSQQFKDQGREVDVSLEPIAEHRHLRARQSLLEKKEERYTLR